MTNLDKEDSSEEMEKKLSALIADEDFKELSKVQNVYCPFEALKVAPAEIRHSNFLADILNPNSNHGFGDSILKKFIGRLLHSIEEENLVPKDYDLSNTEIRREWKNIDLLLRLPNFRDNKDLIFVIEVKVESDEREDQLKRYKELVETQWEDANRFFYFLTIDGHIASHDSWNPLSFKQVVSAIEEGLEESSGDPLAHSMTKSYVDVLKRRYIGDADHIRMIDNIWQKHQEALEYLEEKRYVKLDNLKDLLTSSDFLEKINEKIQKENLTFVYDDHTKKIFRLAIEQWDKLKEFKSTEDWTSSKRSVLFEIFITDNECVVELVLGENRNNEAIREEIYKKFHPDKKPHQRFPRLKKETVLNEKEMEDFLYRDKETCKEVEEKIIKKICGILPGAHKEICAALGQEGKSE